MIDSTPNIPQVNRPSPVQEYKENPFDQDSGTRQEQNLHHKKDKKNKEQVKHQGGDDPELGHVIDIDA